MLFKLNQSVFSWILHFLWFLNESGVDNNCALISKYNGFLFKFTINLLNHGKPPVILRHNCQFAFIKQQNTFRFLLKFVMHLMHCNVCLVKKNCILLLHWKRLIRFCFYCVSQWKETFIYLYWLHTHRKIVIQFAESDNRTGNISLQLNDYSLSKYSFEIFEIE